MSNQKEILTTIANELVQVVEPLKEAFANSESFKGFLYKLGWNVNGLPQEYVELSATVADAVNAVVGLTDGDITSDDIAKGINTIKDLFNRIQAISTAPPGVNAAVFLPEIAERLFEFLLTEYLSRRHPSIYGAFAALDVIVVENIAADANKHAHIRTRFRWEEIPKILQNPLSIIQRVYGWGTPELDANMIFGHLTRLLVGLNVPVSLLRPEDDVAIAYNNNKQLPFTRQLYGLRIPFLYTRIANQQYELGLDILELPPTDGKLPGLVIQPGIPSEIPLTFNFNESLTLSIKAGSDLLNLFGVLIRPDDGITIRYPFQNSATFPSVGFSAALDYHPTNPTILFGAAGGIRMETKGGKIGFEVVSQAGDFEVKLLTEIHDLALVLAAGQGDGFLQKLLGNNEVNVKIPLGIDWSSKTGFGFRGSMNFSIALHPHLALGPIEIPQIQLALSVPSGETKPKINIEVGININGNFGPLQVVVEEIGLGLYTTFEKGNLGPLNISAGFKPPNGLGLSINAGAVIGGGYLFFDFEKEEYAGALELTIAGFISAKAIGLITTKMPDGSKGFSMIIIITAEFNPPFQLGYGFTLMGVGGLLGLNRTVLLDPLREGVRTGAVNNIMFPQNVIANATRIISDLKTIFPAYEGKFLIGPMAKIGWGTPTLVSISFGLIIEIPGNIAILGVLSVILPDKAAAIVKIQVAFVGTIDFDKQMLTFDASLYESSILTMTLEGDMAVRLKWGDSPDFIFTVGGFHPSFTPPPLALPTLKRLAINILNTSIARIRVECYQAITSNTVQFGARADIFFDLSVCSITGFIAFDALFQFSPFYFIISISAGFKLRVAGFDLLSVRVSMSLEGPTPWRAKGTGSISILFFEVSADFDKTWGEQRNTTLESKAILTELLAALNKKEQWSTLLSTSKNLYVSLRTLDEATESLLVLHPAGSLVVQQKLLPFTINIDKIGNQKVSDVKQISVVSAQSGSSNLQLKTVNEDFARAQYQNLSDAEKLSKPSFEKMPGGVEISMSGNLIKNGKLVRKEIKYELTVIDKEPTKKRNKFFTLSGVLFTNFLKGNSVSKLPISKAYNTQLKPFEEKVELSQPGYTVAFQSNNKAFDANATFESEMAAQTYMQTVIKQQPNLKSQVHIVPNFELQEI